MKIITNQRLTKLFTHERPDKNIIYLLDTLGLIDSSLVELNSKKNIDSLFIPIVIKDDGLRTANYIVCKNNPQKIKKVLYKPKYYSLNKIVKKVRCKCK